MRRRELRWADEDESASSPCLEDEPWQHSQRPKKMKQASQELASRLSGHALYHTNAFKLLDHSTQISRSLNSKVLPVSVCAYACHLAQ